MFCLWSASSKKKHWDDTNGVLLLLGKQYGLADLPAPRRTADFLAIIRIFVRLPVAGSNLAKGCVYCIELTIISRLSEFVTIDAVEDEQFFTRVFSSPQEVLHGA